MTSISHNYPKIPDNLRKGLVKEILQELFNDAKGHGFPSDMLFTYFFKPSFGFDSKDTIDLIFEYLKKTGCFKKCNVGNLPPSEFMFLISIKGIDYKILKELIIHIDFITGNCDESENSKLLELGGEIYIDPETFVLRIKDNLYDENSSETLNARGLIFLILSKKTEEIKDRKAIAKVLVDCVKKKKKVERPVNKENKFLNNAVTEVNKLLRKSTEYQIGN